MTITVNRWIVVLSIAVVGVLAGLALGQATQAFSSSNPPATASYAAPFEQTLKEMAHDLHAIKASVGRKNIVSGSIVELLEQIRGNTYATCENTGGSALCHHSPF